MKYNKFIFLYTSNFCARVNDFFCIEEWIANGYDVEYWDLSAFTCHEHLAEFPMYSLVQKEVRSKREFEKLVKKYQQYETLYLTWVNYCWYSSGFYRVISKYNCDYAFFDNGLIPPLSSKNMNSLTIKRIVNGIRNHYYHYLSKTSVLKPASFYFRLSESFIGVDRTDSKTIKGWCNSGDYERNRNLKKVREDNYIVFLDQYIPYHNDNILNGQRQVNADEYFTSLNRCFAIIEKIYGAPVVIAAHPAANKYKENNPFNGRELVYNQTSELVKGSDMVIAHFTTAVSYVILNKKKMILLTSQSIKEVRPQIDSYIVNLAEIVGQNCVNQDTVKEEELKAFDISEEKYNDYKYRYLTNHFSENMSNFESIINTLEAEG